MIKLNLLALRKALDPTPLEGRYGRAQELLQRHGGFDQLDSLPDRYAAERVDPSRWGAVEELQDELYELRQVLARDPALRDILDRLRQRREVL